MSQKLTLWALRFSVAWGNRYVPEREVTEETAQGWLEVFRKGEPHIEFVVSARRPKVKKV